MPSQVETRTVPAGDGRELCVDLGGDPAGKPVLVCVGMPMARTLYRGWTADAEKKGIRLIGYDRPGYGGSTPNPGYTVASGARDVRAIAGSLGYDRIGVWGISGGGPYALACAALLPDLVAAAAAVASFGPHDAEGFDWYAGMGESNAESFRQNIADPETSRRELGEGRQEILDTPAEDFGSTMEGLLPPPDAAFLTDDLLRWQAEAHKTALAPGDQGWWDDAMAVVTSWGFDLGGIRVPVKIWHGRQDVFIPVQHGEWLAAAIPGAEADISDRDGHLTLIGRAGEFHDWLLRHL